MAFEALNEARNYLDYFRKDNPRCPHCGDVCEIDKLGWWDLYSENNHEKTCPSCNQDFMISTHAEYSFRTDEQED